MVILQKNLHIVIKLFHFRNCICHFDVKQFSIDNSIFVDALLYFEKIVNCKYRFSKGSLEKLVEKSIDTFSINTTSPNGEKIQLQASLLA